MLDRQRLLEWQNQREEDDRRWRQEQAEREASARRAEAKDRRKEIKILFWGVVASILVGVGSIVVEAISS